MTRTYTTILLTTLAALYGCQPDTPAQHAAPAPAISAPLAASQVQVTAPPAAAQQEPKAVVAVADTDGRVLAQKSGCFACHAIDKKLVGPAWNDVAAKYRGQKDAEAKLIAKVAKGGSGVWGSTPMPPNEPRVKENDIQTLVRFILSLK